MDPDVWRTRVLLCLFLSCLVVMAPSWSASADASATGGASTVFSLW